MKTLSATLALFLATTSALAQNAPTSQPPSPEQHLGRPIGTDFKLADWAEVSAYYQKLSQQTKTVQVRTLGKTAEGRDFLLVTITSEANLANLSAIQAANRTLHDPRGKSGDEKEQALKTAKVSLVMTPTMHSTEVAATEMAMHFAYQLATSNEEPFKSARENCVIYLTPTLNPDGLDHVVSFYRETVGTPYEAAALTKLYQKYTGHDNNRDYFMMTQPETRMMSTLMYDKASGIAPTILWDVHQQGNKRERMFIPPYRDPLNPNIDPAVVQAINLLGTRAAFDMTRDGFTGVNMGSTYDAWWTGGNRSTPARHNVIGILTECASANLASPIFQQVTDLRSSSGDTPYGPTTSMPAPWPGGWWRVGDIVRYELAFGRSLLAMINREPDLWKRTTLASAENAVAPKKEGVQGWIIPADNRDGFAVRRLVDALQVGGIEISTLTEDFKTPSATYAKGSLLIRRDQPYGGHVKDLFELQKYPELKPPYDVAGWTLPLLMGVTRVELFDSLAEAKTTAVTEAAKVTTPPDSRAKDGALSLRDSAAWGQLATDLQAGKSYTLTTRGPNAGLLTPSASNTETRSLTLKKLPRIGVYAPWTGSMDEGWLRYCLEMMSIPYTTVRNQQIRAGNLKDTFDVLIVADISASTLNNGRPDGTIAEQFTAGLAPEGTAALADFLHTGGNLITFNAASNWAIKAFSLPVSSAMTSRAAEGADSETGSGAAKFSCLGSVLRSIPDDGSPFTADLPPSIPLFFADATAFRESGGRSTTRGSGTATTLLRYAGTDLLLSGYISKPSQIENQSAWTHVRLENGGGVHLFAFQPHYRSWTQGTLPLLMRAIFLNQEVRSAQ